MQAIVIGTGSMGRIHTRIYKQLGVLSGVYDANTLSSYETGKNFDTLSFPTLESIFDLKPDIATIATPTNTHHEIAIKCIEKGINVLIEKPIADTLDNANKIRDAVNANNVIATVGYIERYNPVFVELLRRIKNNAFGEITSINIKRVGGVPRSADNVVIDVMTHDLNLLLTLFGRFPEQTYTHFRETGDIVHSAQTLLDFKTASATCEANWVSPTKIRTIALTGTDSYAEVDMIKQEITQFDAYTRTTHIFNEEPLKNELIAFLEAVKTKNTNQIVSIKDAVDTLLLTAQAAENIND